MNFLRRSALVLCLLAVFIVPASVVHAGTQYYVNASTGSNSNDGLSATVGGGHGPWLTFRYAAEHTLSAGDVVNFASGTYTDPSNGMINFASSGSAGNPITFVSTSQYGAIITAPTGAKNTYKLGLDAKSNVVFDGFEFTQATLGDSASYDDKLIWIGVNGASNNVTVKNSKLHNSQTPIKVTTSSADALIDNNTIYDCYQCLASYGGVRPVFQRNTIQNPLLFATPGTPGDGIQTKGGTRSAQVRDNLIQLTSTNTAGIGIDLGGSSGGATGDCTGCSYEGYYNTAVNNIVTSNTTAGWAYGMMMQGCEECGAYHNDIYKAGTAMREQNGGGWSSHNHNPVWKNNIVETCSNGLTDDGNTTGRTVDYNLFRNPGCTTNIPSQSNPQTGDPLITNWASNWTLSSQSSAAYNHATYIASKTGYYSESIPLNVDRAGLSRTSGCPVQIGAYQTFTNGLYAHEVAASSPSSYWRLGEPSGTTASPYVGAISGTYAGGPTLGATSNLTCDADTAVTFDGTNDALSMGDNYGFTGTTSFSVEFWYKSPSSWPGTTQMLVQKSRNDGSGNRHGWNVSVDTTPHFYFQRWHDTNAQVATTNTTTLATSTWYHVVATYDGTTMKLYVNNGTASTASDSTSITAATPTTANFGVDLDGGTFYYVKGTLDEIAVWSGTALSSGTISTHYNAR